MRQDPGFRFSNEAPNMKAIAIPIGRFDAECPRFRVHDSRINYFVKGAPTQNFGDYLPEILAKEFMLHPRVEADIYRLIGSVIDTAWILRDLRHTIGVQSGQVAFWCSGMRTGERLDPKVQAMCSFFGVRGPLTRVRLGLPGDTVVGDPGLLAPLFHTPVKLPEYENRSVCIPHIHDPKPDAQLLNMSGADILLRPEIPASEQELRRILDKITSASFVLTGALHAAVIACAYGRPFAFWDNGHLDIPFKWFDFASSINIPCVFVRNVDEGKKWYRDSVLPQVRVPPLAPILEVCPFFVRPSALLRALCYDGRLEAAEARLAAQVLEELDCFQPKTVYRLQDWSAHYRAHRDSLKQVIRVHVGRAKEVLKEIVKKIAFFASPTLTNVAHAAAVHKYRNKLRA
jgi:hypothetical protein